MRIELKVAQPADTVRRLADLKGVFKDAAAWAAMPADTLVYEVWMACPVAEGVLGGLFYGITHILPGKVGGEYFMTKGHFHALRDRAEYYRTEHGEGLLLLMDEAGETRFEKMSPGSAHYIPGHTAHRTVNTGSEILSFSAVWPSDAGHDYESIANRGFSQIVVEQNGQPVLTTNPNYAGTI